MKKFLIYFTLVFAIILLSGCTMDNTPTKKVENFLDNYRNLDSTVVNQMDSMIQADNLMTDDQRETYGNVLKRQYQDMTYEIKDEIINGDDATVTAEIEVYDFYKATNDATTYYNTNPSEFMDDAGNLVDSLFVDYRINSLNKMKDTVTYTIDFTLVKVDDVWTLNDVDDITRQKIHGLYAY